MALDEPKEDDEKFEFEGLTIMVAPDLTKKTGDIKVDYVNHAYGGMFRIQPSKPLGKASSDACGSCSC